MKIIFHFGRFFILMAGAFRRPEKFSVFWRQMLQEMVNFGFGSLGIVVFISIFMGAVITIQTAAQIESAWIPLYTVGFTARQTIILEFSPTIIALILAGKVGSNIASEIGTMRVTEQIDALEIMGINPASYLIAPKVVAAVLVNPFLIAISMFVAMMGGWVVGVASGATSTYEYVYGLQYDFRFFHVAYSLIKTLFFAFIITSVPAYFGFFTKGGAIEVGRSSTRAVVYSSVVLLVVNYILTQIILM